MEDFCHSHLWDRELSWNTTDPYFTDCFEETVLVWIPLGFLITFSFVDIHFSVNSKRQDLIPWNVYTIAKCVVNVILAIIAVLNIVVIQSFADRSNANSVAPIIRLITYFTAITLLILSKHRGIRSSGVQFFFWLSVFTCECILFRTAIRKYDGGLGFDIKDNFLYFVRLVSFPFVILQLLLHCWADRNFGGKNSVGKNSSPEKTSSFLSKLFLFWCDGFVWKGYRNYIKQPDLWDLNEVDRSEVQSEIFDKYWEIVQEKAKIESKISENTVQPSVFSVLVKAYGLTFIFSGVLKLIQDLLVFATPELLRLLIAHINSDKESPQWHGFLYAGLLFMVSLVQTILNAHQQKRIYLYGLRARTVCNNAIFKKSLCISNTAKKNSTLGEVVNLMSVDTQKLVDLGQFIHLLWSAPIQIALATYMLYNTLGVSAFSGVAVMILFIPFNAIVASKIKLYQIEQMTLKDKRMKLIGHLLSGIKVIKLYACERSFKNQIEKVRQDELHILKISASLNSVIICSFYCMPFLVSLVTFATFVLSSETNYLNVEIAFVALTLFNIMKMPMTMFPNVIGTVLAVGVSIKRINAYLNSEELDPNSIAHNANEDDPIVIKNGKFSWTAESTTLKDINLKIKKGSLVAIVGRVGAGKSSLLGAILGDLTKESGIVNTMGSIAYVSQVAWIQNATVKENVLFTAKNIDFVKYMNIIEACALAPDFKVLPEGDNTEIGERGVTLSGGQKQRISLARAAYKESDTFLLDSPLSAVDSHVGKHIFDKLIGPNGLLKDKTRILVTHDLSCLPQVDYILVMKDGRIIDRGTYSELVKNDKFTKLLKEHPNLQNGGKNLESNIHITENTGFQNLNSIERKSSSQNDAVQKVTQKGRLIEDEKVKTGNVNYQIYLDYVKKAGFGLFAFTIAFSLLFQALAAYANVWLSDWSTQATEDEDANDIPRDTTKYLSVFAGLGFLQILVMYVSTQAMALSCLTSARKWHSTILTRVIRAPMSYFETTPVGRIVNVFARDVDSVDNFVPIMMRSFVNNLLPVISSLILIAISTPAIVLFIVPCCVVYITLQRFYANSSRQLKRLEATSRAPMFSHFGETIAGAETIRAFSIQQYFIDSFQQKLNYNLQSYYPLNSTTVWLSLRLEGIGSLIIFAAALFAVLAKGNISSGFAGLSITSALMITQQLFFFAKVTTELENSIVSVERMKELSKIPQEASWEGKRTLPKCWPEKGIIQFDQYETRYRENLDTVLKRISLDIKSCERIGLVGRTGAGKSSMTLALLRIIEPTGGRILIDGIDISQIGLEDVRSNITMIPQDPILFTGTIRLNLDPFNTKNDEDLWKCLDLAYLKKLVESLPERLDYQVSEDGHNFSVGQRQLFCLARALLHKKKILLLDEATASVDLETDNLIQKTVKEEFRDSTVITIAHRLHTIIDSDRVIVLDGGRVVEFDAPETLLRQTNSFFRKMAKDAQIV